MDYKEEIIKMIRQIESQKVLVYLYKLVADFISLNDKRP